MGCDAGREAIQTECSPSECAETDAYERQLEPAGRVKLDITEFGGWFRSHLSSCGWESLARVSILESWFPMVLTTAMHIVYKQPPTAPTRTDESMHACVHGW